LLVFSFLLLAVGKEQVTKGTGKTLRTRSLIVYKACNPPRKKLHHENLPEFLQMPLFKKGKLLLLALAIGFWLLAIST
jgi:hypothetical protein